MSSIFNFQPKNTLSVDDTIICLGCSFCYKNMLHIWTVCTVAVVVLVNEYCLLIFMQSPYNVCKVKRKTNIRNANTQSQYWLSASDIMHFTSIQNHKFILIWIFDESTITDLCATIAIGDNEFFMVKAATFLSIPRNHGCWTVFCCWKVIIVHCVRTCFLCCWKRF